MAKLRINGRDYQIPEMDFDAVCELEERGVNLFGMENVEKNGKMLTTIRGLVAWVMDTDLKTAGHEINEHLKNGGGLEEIIYGINGAINDSGFFQDKKPKRPQDHKVAQYPKKRKNRRNGNRSRR